MSASICNNSELFCMSPLTYEEQLHLYRFINKMDTVFDKSNLCCVVCQNEDELKYFSGFVFSIERMLQRMRQTNQSDQFIGCMVLKNIKFTENSEINDILEACVNYDIHTLYMYDCSFADLKETLNTSALDFVPEDFVLENLYLHCSIYEAQNHLMMDLIKNTFNKINHLYFDHFRFYPDDIFALNDILRVSSLETLKFNKCSMSDDIKNDYITECLVDFTDALWTNSSLTSLDMRGFFCKNPKFYSEVDYEICQILSNKETLITLSMLSYDYISVVKVVSNKAITNLEIEFYDNDTEDTCEELYKALCQNSSIESLSIHTNCIGMVDSVIRSLKKNSSINKLNITIQLNTDVHNEFMPLAEEALASYIDTYIKIKDKCFEDSGDTIEVFKKLLERNISKMISTNNSLIEFHLQYDIIKYIEETDDYY